MAQHEPDLDFCEYEREGDGEVRHVLQCLCECTDFDKLVDDYLNSLCRGPKSSVPPRERLRRVFFTASDRCRIPWFGGARRLNAGALAAPVMLLLLRAVLRLSTYAPWLLFWLAVGASHLAWFHVACLSLPLRSDYFVSWVACSIAGLYSEYWSEILPRQSSSSTLLCHGLLLVVVISFASAVYTSPPVQDAEQGQLQSEKEDSRWYLCKVCGHAIYGRDHHCVWINQCVGAHNHRSFVLFVASLTLLAWAYASMVLTLSASLEEETRFNYLMVHLADWRLKHSMAGALYAFGGGLFTAILLLGQLFTISKGLTGHELRRRERRPQRKSSCLQNWRSWLAGGVQKDGEFSMPTTDT
eukprot:s2413_g3.t1